MTVKKGSYRLEAIADEPSKTEVQREFFFKNLYNIQEKHTQYLQNLLIKKILLE